MAFTIKYRSELPNKITQKYSTYWHAVHPLTFDPVELIYRQAFQEDEWEALQLLRKNRPEVITRARTFTFKPTMLRGRDDSVHKKARVCFYLPEPMPKVVVKDTELPHDHLREILEWVLVAYRHKEEKETLRRRIYHLMQHENINTPGQLFAVWPPDVRYRDVMRNRRCKSSMPRGWTSEKVKKFNEGEGAERLDHVMTVLALTDYERTDDYPQLL